MRELIFFTLSFLIATNVIYGCSIQRLPLPDDPFGAALSTGKPIYLNPTLTKPNYYVFIGEVVEIVKAAKAEVGENKRDAEGLKIKVAENIYSLQKAAYYEVFPLRMESDCSLQGITDIAKSFPIGSQVRVIASDATIYKKQFASDSITRLEVSFKNDGRLVRNDLEKDFQLSRNSVFDYSKFQIQKPSTPEEYEIYSRKIDLLEFELQKDLARLRKAQSEVERLEVLKRLIYYPRNFWLSYRTLLYTYLKPGKELSELEKKWLRRNEENIPKS